jgi:transglutaminase-like putative cysteine protease
LFTVTGLANGTRISIATMDTYNGVVYTVGSAAVSSESGSFARVPAAIPRSGGTPVEYSVDIAGLNSVWLPFAGDLEAISFEGDRSNALTDSFFFNKTTGNGAVIGGLADGDSYTVRAVLPDQPTDDELAAATPGTAQVPQPTGVPDELVAAVDDYTAGLDTPGDKLVAVIDAIRATGYISHGIDPDVPFSRSGHSADRLIRLLSETPMLGDGEQYATAVALMANQIGFPARVVLGFTPESGTATVAGANVSAWVEVNTAGSGWVPLTATPDDRKIPEKLPDETEQISRPQVVVPPPPPPEDTLVEPQRPAGDEDQKDQPDPFWGILFEVLRVVGISAAILAVLLAPFVTILVLKATRRKRRRRSANPRASIAGGWADLVDTATDYGYRVPLGVTRSEFVAAVGQPQLATLADEADEAVFGPVDAPPQAADRYWTDLETLRKSWAKDYSRWERLKATFALRSLAGYHFRRPQRGGQK